MTATTPLLAFPALGRRTPGATINGLPEVRGRRQAPRRGSAAAIPSSGDVEKAGQTGNHTDGVTVADLIAKVHGAASVPKELRRTRPEPEPEPEPQAPPTEVIAAVHVDPGDPDTEVIPVVAGYASEVPDLAALRRRARVHPSRVGTGRSAGQPEPRRGRNRSRR